MTRIPPAVAWRCMVIALIPIVTWAIHDSSTRVIWQRAGSLHYQVRLDPDADAACLILRRRDITPGLAPYVC